MFSRELHAKFLALSCICALSGCGDTVDDGDGKDFSSVVSSKVIVSPVDDCGDEPCEVKSLESVDAL